MHATRLGGLAIVAVALVAGCDRASEPAEDATAGGDASPPADAAFTDAGPADAASASYAFDLDGDDVPDTNLAIGACAADAQATCLAVTSRVVADREIQVAATRDECTGTLVGRRLEVIGDHVGDERQEVSVLHCRNDGATSPPALAIVDASTGEVVAEAVAPSAQINAFVDYPTDPAGKRHPFLAPSYGDGGNAAGNWGYLCLYRPSLAGGSTCGAGFVSASTVPPGASYFREVGGYLQDLDADGWQDITLIYHQLVHTVSTATALAIDTLEYDVAATTEPGSAAWFHSGRNYGTHVALDAGGGTLRAVEVGGAPVGTFADYNCNVSRFVAVLETTAGTPSSRALRWSAYYGFASTIFSVIDPAYAADPSAVVARPADVMDDCIHRFSDSRSVMDGQQVLLFNYFDQDAPFDRCLAEQYALYLPPAWTPEKATAWYECFATNVASPGVWGMQVLREADGAGLTGSQGTYVWGWSTALHPSGEVLYLVELVPGSGRFDLVDRAPSALAVYALVDGLWSARGTFPVAGRPAIRAEAPAGARGAGSYTYFAELALTDRDDDGLLDVQLDGGEWVGFSTALGGFELK